MSTKRDTTSVSYDYDLDGSDNEAYEAYVPLKKRRAEQLQKLTGGGKGAGIRAGKAASEEAELQLTQEEIDEQERARKRTERTLLAEAQEVHKRKAEQGRRNNPEHPT